MNKSQSICSVNAIIPLVAFYDIHGRREVLFFYFVPDTTRDIHIFVKFIHTVLVGLKRLLGCHVTQRVVLVMFK
jgi:hypothetical protein